MAVLLLLLLLLLLPLRVHALLDFFLLLLLLLIFLVVLQSLPGPPAGFAGGAAGAAHAGALCWSLFVDVCVCVVGGWRCFLENVMMRRSLWRMHSISLAHYSRVYTCLAHAHPRTTFCGCPFTLLAKTTGLSYQVLAARAAKGAAATEIANAPRLSTAQRTSPPAHHACGRVAPPTAFLCAGI